MSFTLACSVDEIVAGKPHPVTVDDVDVALVRDGDDFYAIRDECSHANIALSEGDVDGCLIECWLHGSTFDLRTGQPTTLPAFEPVAVYPVRVEGDELHVDVHNPLNGVTA
ncbi:MAG TPA: non-heme iron oxygenase ferredoxin subunit [Marmoricola sp.]|nr:non-heme iron oxygenase ferredoxin subunit [Marmoricola sp.]